MPLVGGMNAEDLKNNQVFKRTVNESLQNIKVVVACDRNSKPGPKGNFNYGLINTGTENGFLHSKIILFT